MSRLMDIFANAFFFFGAESESEEDESEDEDDDDVGATGGVCRDVRARFLVCTILPNWSLSENRSDLEVPMVMLSVG